MELLGGLSAINAAIGIGKSVIHADNALDTATLKAKLADLMIELANAKISQVELIEKNTILSKEISRINESNIEIALLKELEGYHYQPDEEGNVIGWPACPSCLNKEKRVVILVQNGDIQSAKCPRCTSVYVPVASFISPGLSRAEHRRIRRAENQANANAQIQGYKDSWMNR